MRQFSKRKKRNPDGHTVRERFRAFGERRAYRARQRAYADRGANDAWRERPRSGAHDLMSPVPYDPGGLFA